MARLYELASAIDGLKPKDAADKWAKREALEIFVRLTGPMTPHLAEELWQSLGHKSLLADSPWPLAEDALLVDDTVTDRGAGQRQAARHHAVAEGCLAKEAQRPPRRCANGDVQKAMAGKTPKRVIVVPNRIVNIVV